MSDWLLNLPVLWMAVVVFAAIYLLTGRTSAPSRPLTMPSPPSTRPSDARGRRSFAFAREASGRASGCTPSAAASRPRSPRQRYWRRIGKCLNEAGIGLRSSMLPIQNHELMNVEESVALPDNDQTVPCPNWVKSGKAASAVQSPLATQYQTARKRCCPLLAGDERF